MNNIAGRTGTPNFAELKQPSSTHRKTGVGSIRVARPSRIFSRRSRQHDSLTRCPCVSKLPLPQKFALAFDFESQFDDSSKSSLRTITSLPGSMGALNTFLISFALNTEMQPSRFEVNGKVRSSYKSDLIWSVFEPSRDRLTFWLSSQAVMTVDTPSAVDRSSINRVNFAVADS